MVCGSLDTHRVASLPGRRPPHLPQALRKCSQPMGLRPRMNLLNPQQRCIEPRAVALGKFVLSPMSHPTGYGTFRASVTVSSGRGIASHHRIYRFSRQHTSREAAHLVALTQGWLHTCDSGFVAC